MPRPTPLPSAASYPSCAPSNHLVLALALAAAAATGCYTGAEPLPGEPWERDDDTGATGEADSAPLPGDGEATRGETVGGEAGTGDDGNGEAGTGDAGSDDDAGNGGSDGDGGSDGGDPPPADVPDNPYCAEVADWEPAWVQLELDILEQVNEVRAAGANCGSEGSFGPAPPLTMNLALRCAARKHSKDMNDRSFFDHTNPSGESPWDRMGMAGYSYSSAGENIAGGSPNAAGTMDQWMNSDGHCSNIMSPDFEEIGVGYYPGGQWGHLWTQAFGAQ